MPYFIIHWEGEQKSQNESFQLFIEKLQYLPVMLKLLMTLHVKNFLESTSVNSICDKMEKPSPAVTLCGLVLSFLDF